MTSRSSRFLGSARFRNQSEPRNLAEFAEPRRAKLARFATARRTSPALIGPRSRRGSRRGSASFQNGSLPSPLAPQRPEEPAQRCANLRGPLACVASGLGKVTL